MSTHPADVFDWSRAGADWSRAVTGAMRSATQGWSQPILPGWTFNLNSNNSSAPQTEVEVLGKYSYGKQLGRISDALGALIDKLPKAERSGTAFEPFTEMKNDIDTLKQDAALARIARIEADLHLLKTAQPAEYERVCAALRRTLAR